MPKFIIVAPVRFEHILEQYLSVGFFYVKQKQNWNNSHEIFTSFSCDKNRRKWFVKM